MTTTRKLTGPRPTDPDPTTTGANVRRVRISRGLTQRQMAEALGYTGHAGWSYVESGRTILSDTDLIKAAAYLGVAPSVIRAPKATR